jgi:hypothetical protein
MIISKTKIENTTIKVVIKQDSNQKDGVKSQ